MILKIIQYFFYSIIPIALFFKVLDKFVLKENKLSKKSIWILCISLLLYGSIGSSIINEIVKYEECDQYNDVIGNINLEINDWLGNKYADEIFDKYYKDCYEEPNYKDDDYRHER